MFYFYEKFKSILLPYKRPNESDLRYRVISGAGAGIISNSVTYFLDPVKATMSSDFEGKAGSITDILSKIYSKKGIRGFYQGWGATM